LTSIFVEINPNFQTMFLVYPPMYASKNYTNQTIIQSEPASQRYETLTGENFAPTEQILHYYSNFFAHNFQSSNLTIMNTPATEKTTRNTGKMVIVSPYATTLPTTNPRNHPHKLKRNSKAKTRTKTQRKMKMTKKPAKEQHTISNGTQKNLPDFVANVGPAAAAPGVGGVAGLLQSSPVSGPEVIVINSDSSDADDDDDVSFVYLTPPVKPTILFQHTVQIKQEHTNLLEELTSEELFGFGEDPNAAPPAATLTMDAPPATHVPNPAPPAATVTIPAPPAALDHPGAPPAAMTPNPTLPVPPPVARAFIEGITTLVYKGDSNGGQDKLEALCQVARLTSSFHPGIIPRVP
jgi:hypothetical protein